MPNLNICHFIGNLTRDPELRVTPKGTSVAQFTLAINREWKNDSGQKQEEVTFLDFEAWGKTGEIICKYCSKGRPLYVTARARVDTWDDKDSGKKRTRVRFVVEAMQFLGGGREGEAGATDARPRPYGNGTEQNPTTYGRPPAPAAHPRGVPAQGDADEDVPF